MARVASLALTIPFFLMAAPLIGLFGGRWLDGRLGTAWIEYLGLILGVIAGIQQTYLGFKRLMREFDR